MLEYFEILKKAILEENLYETNNILENIKYESNSFEYVERIFELIENNPNLYFGNPGPIVHFMELYYKKGYEDLLLKSVNKCPTMQTIFMMSRVINDPKLEEREKYINTLKTLLQKNCIDKEIKEEIESILSYQN